MTTTNPPPLGHSVTGYLLGMVKDEDLRATVRAELSAWDCPAEGLQSVVEVLTEEHSPSLDPDDPHVFRDALRAVLAVYDELHPEPWEVASDA